MEKHIEILVDRKEYITKEEIYKAINEQYHETGLDGYQDGIELMNRIAKIPAADVVEVVRWIPVTERLPKDEKDVLAYYGFKHDGVLSDQRFIGTLCYFRFDPNPHWQHEGQGKLTVTHWMPLPEPPKENGKSET